MLHSQTQNGYHINIPSSFHGYNIVHYIGCGSTCIVALVEDQISHEKFSAKIMAKKDIENRNLLNSVLNEIKILKSINHPNIIKIREAFEIKNEHEEEYYIMIMEYCSNGNLLNYVSKQGFKNEAEKRKIIIGFLEAIKFLHNKEISHGDIKSENVLLDKNMCPKLCDFGFSRTTVIAGDELKNGTLYYASPELFHKGTFNTLKSDIWAIGITLYSLCELQFPFQSSDQDSIVNQILNGQLSVRSGINLKFKKLFEKCTMKNPNLRPTIDEILHHEYFANREISKNNKFIIPKKKMYLNMTFKDTVAIDSKTD